MSRVVWKHRIPVDDRYHDAPPGTVVHVAADPDALNDTEVLVWIEHPAPVRQVPGVRLRVFATGQTVPSGWEHQGTAQVGPFVWHVYRTAVG